MSIYNIPAELRSLRQWMLADENKRPMAWNGVDLFHGQKNNPNHWMTFDDALALSNDYPMRLGFCTRPDDPFTIIDMDNLGNASPNKAQNSDEALAAQEYLVQQAVENGWYLETSKSGFGAHIIVRDKLVRDARMPGVEFYGHAGFVVLTGMHAQGEPKPLSAELAGFLTSWIGERSFEHADCAVSMEDFNKPMEVGGLEYEQYARIWQQIFSASNGDRYKKFAEGLDIGQLGEDASANDFDLLQRIYGLTKGMGNRALATARAYRMQPRYRKYLIEHKNHKGDAAAYLFNQSLPKAVARVNAEEAEVEKARQWAQAHAPAKVGAPAPMDMGSMRAQPAPFESEMLQPMKFDFKKASEVADENPPAWAIDDVFMEQSVNAIYGWSAVGKSFVAIDMVLAVAEGRPWIDRVTKQMSVSYLALEGGEGFGQRLRAAAIGKGKALPDNIEIYRGRFNLMDENHVSGLIASRKAAGVVGGMIVIDTLSKAAMQLNENDNKDMAGLVINAERIKQELNACVVIIHHSTKPDPKTGLPGMMRGGGALQAGIDGVVAVCRRKEQVDAQSGEVTPHRRFVALEKVKEGKDSNEYDFNLAVEKVADQTRPDGSIKEVESCYVEWVSEQVNSSVAPVANVGTPPGGSTYSPRERSTGTTRPKTKAENASGRYDISSVIPKALELGADRVKHANKGRYGAPPDRDPTPREELVTIIGDLINPDEIDSAFKTAVKNALNYAVNSGKVGRNTESGKQYYWLI